MKKSDAQGSRNEMIERLMLIASAVFHAEDRISASWDGRLKEAEHMDKEGRAALAEEYLRAIAEEMLTVEAEDQSLICSMRTRMYS